MSGLIVTGILTFAATSIDDILILVAFFSQANASFRPRHVVVGQYLGFAVLVGVSLLGFLGGLVVPQPWIGLLGFALIVIGVRKFLGRNKEVEIAEPQKPPYLTRLPGFDALLNPYTYQVIVVTIANGGDNIGIYTPLFASSSLVEFKHLARGVLFIGRRLVSYWLPVNP